MSRTTSRPVRLGLDAIDANELRGRLASVTAVARERAVARDGTPVGGWLQAVERTAPFGLVVSRGHPLYVVHGHAADDMTSQLCLRLLGPSWIYAR